MTIVARQSLFEPHQMYIVAAILQHTPTVLPRAGKLHVELEWMARRAVATNDLHTKVHRSSQLVFAREQCDYNTRASHICD